MAGHSDFSPQRPAKISSGEQGFWFSIINVKHALKLPQLSSTPPMSDAEFGLHMVDLLAAILSTIASITGVADVIPNCVFKSSKSTKKSKK